VLLFSTLFRLGLNVAEWTIDVLRAGALSGVAPEQALRDLTAARRHMFQAAGLFDALPWKLQW
jgi:hypothetical protein